MGAFLCKSGNNLIMDQRRDDQIRNDLEHKKSISWTS